MGMQGMRGQDEGDRIRGQGMGDQGQGTAETVVIRALSAKIKINCQTLSGPLRRCTAKRQPRARSGAAALV